LSLERQFAYGQRPAKQREYDPVRQDRAHQHKHTPCLAGGKG